ncbi:hypothetical protein AB9C03_23960, partial [Escherichia coli]
PFLAEYWFDAPNKVDEARKVLLAKINFIQPFDFIDVRFYFGERFSLPFISKLQVYILLTSQYM